MKSNFTDLEIGKICLSLGSKLYVRVNKAGNIDVIDPNRSNNEHFVLYLTDDKKYLWRRHNGQGYCYPLNMKGRKFEGSVYKHRNVYTNKIEYWGYKPYNVNMSKFNTVDESIDYFIHYLKKYKSINV